MKWAILTLAIILWAIWKLWPRQQTTFFPKRFVLPAGSKLEVYINGTKMEEGKDYTETDGVIVILNETPL